MPAVADPAAWFAAYLGYPRNNADCNRGGRIAFGDTNALVTRSAAEGGRRSAGG